MGEGGEGVAAFTVAPRIGGSRSLSGPRRAALLPIAERWGRFMASKRGDQEPWMSAEDYGRSLRGFQVGLLVKDVTRSVAFAREVLEAKVIYADPDFAVLRHG